MRWMGLSVCLVLVGLLLGCPTYEFDQEREQQRLEECEECLESGGTWQVSGCTENCEIMDTSCFQDECPGSCLDDCGNCFSENDCMAVGCSWRTSAEAMWCTG